MNNLNGNNFWSYEWNKHGVCYQQLLKQKHPKLADSDIFVEFFKKVISEYDKLTANFKISSGRYANLN